MFTVSAHAGQRKDAQHIGLQMRIVGDAFQVGFEQAVVGGVKADQGDEGADVGFGECGAVQVGAVVGQAGF